MNPKKKKLANWSLNESVETWHGVTFSTLGHVSKLELGATNASEAFWRGKLENGSGRDPRNPDQDTLDMKKLKDLVTEYLLWLDLSFNHGVKGETAINLRNCQGDDTNLLEI